MPRSLGRGGGALTPAAPPVSGARTIVCDIDLVFYDRSYFLIPDATGEGPARAYHLLVDAMKDERRAAIGGLVLRPKERLAAIRVRDGLLQITTMRKGETIRAAQAPEAVPDPLEALERNLEEVRSGAR